ncbi:hypothetical protein ACFL6M_04390 [Candidatus Eisenbacteria bacterium]|uniref:Uncharacterized protein n=1 Tax=Eiseniibacteriota bacterium TaxID=2212470 RepID=A0ABV6YKG9_UNCEI
MTGDEKSLTQRVRDGLATDPGEHILTILKAGLATTPFCGGIASLMSDYIPSSKMARLEAFAEQLAADLNAVQERVDQAVILSDEFAFLFEKCFRGVAENYQKEKLTAFRAVLLNSAIGTNHSSDEEEYFLNLVSALSVLHLRMLWFMTEPESYLKQYGIPADQIAGGFQQFLPRAIPGVALETIKSAFGDLYRYDLISTDKSIFTTMTVGQGLALLRGRVSDHGKAFVAFCRSPLD